MYILMYDTVVSYHTCIATTDNDSIYIVKYIVTGICR